MVVEYVQANFPKKGIYRRDVNRIYFSTDFKDGEEITFCGFHGKPNTHKQGLARYTNGSKIKLINIRDIEPIE